MRFILLCGLALPSILPAMATQPETLTPDTILKSARVAAGRDATWAAWTKAGELKQWFGPDARVELRPGGPYEIYFLMDQPHGRRGGEGNTVQAFLPGRMLAFTWNAPPSFGPLREVRTHVVLEFADLAHGGTEVTLTHYGWPAGDDWVAVRQYFEKAWSQVMSSLEKYLGAAGGAVSAHHGRIDYVEFTAADLGRAKGFYAEVFGWRFTDYGPHYTSFDDGRLAGGFSQGEKTAAAGPLIILYAADLEATERRVVAAGGTINPERHHFPGGRRFHFRDPNGNELAVWTDRTPDGQKIE